MRPERYSYHYAHRHALSKSRHARLAVALMAVAALVTLVMTGRSSEHIEALRTTLDAWVSPVMEVVTIPVRGVKNLIADKRALFSAYEDNKLLREENDALRGWQAVAQALKAENEALRALAGYHPVAEAEYVAAAVIAQSPNAYAGTLMINAGLNQGLHSLQPVVDAHGLVGRLMEVGDTQARVLLLSDPRSRVPVVTATSRQHAILVGTGEEMLQLMFIGGNPKSIALGEAILTTAEGGLIPDSVMIGTVFKRDKAGNLFVKPSRPLASAEYVRVMVAK